MSPLTKAFVVLVTVLSILLVTLVVPFVAQVDTLRGEVEDAQAISKAAQQTIADQRAQLTAVTEDLKSKETSLNNAINRLDSEVAQLKGENTSLEAQLAKAQSDNQAISASLVAFAEAEKANAELLRNYKSQLDTAQSKLVAGQTENVQLVDRNNQLQSNLSALERQVRKLREENVALAEEVGSLEQGVVQGGGAIGQGGGVAVQPDEPIYGQITETSQTAANKTLVTLNLGATDGLVRNQRFVAYRGDNELVATLEVLSIDASQSVAAVVGTPQQNINAGDFVVSAPGL